MNKGARDLTILLTLLIGVILFVFGILTSISFNISNSTKSGKFSKAGDTFGILFGILLGILFLGVIFVFRQAIGEFFWGIGSSLSSSISQKKSSGNNNQSRYIVFILFVITLLTTSITTAYFAIKSMHNNLKSKGKLFKMHNFENIMQSVGIMLLIQLSIISITILYQLILREVRNKLKIEPQKGGKNFSVKANLDKENREIKEASEKLVRPVIGKLIFDNRNPPQTLKKSKNNLNLELERAKPQLERTKVCKI